MPASTDKWQWKTQWGTVILQSEQCRGEPRFYYPEWHQDGLKSERPSFSELGSESKRTAINKIQRWVDANGGEVDG